MNKRFRRIKVNEIISEIEKGEYLIIKRKINGKEDKRSREVGWEIKGKIGCGERIRINKEMGKIEKGEENNRRRLKKKKNWRIKLEKGWREIEWSSKGIVRNVIMNDR